MLDRLGSSEQASIKGGRRLVLLHDLSAFVGNADDRRARLALRLLVDCRETCSRRPTWSSVSASCFSNAARSSSFVLPSPSRVRRLRSPSCGWNFDRVRTLGGYALTGWRDVPPTFDHQDRFKRYRHAQCWPV